MSTDLINLVNLCYYWPSLGNKYPLILTWGFFYACWNNKWTLSILFKMHGGSA